MHTTSASKKNAQNVEKSRVLLIKAAFFKLKRLVKSGVVKNFYSLYKRILGPTTNEIELTLLFGSAFLPLST